MQKLAVSSENPIVQQCCEAMYRGNQTSLLNVPTLGGLKTIVGFVRKIERVSPNVFEIVISD